MTRVGLLVVGHVDPKSTHIAGDYPELFARAARRASASSSSRYDLDEGRFPDSLAECDGWLCSPSRSSTYDDDAWIADAEELHRAIVAEERPYVGICFGHQLLAQALGGKVERAADGWGVGVQRVRDRRPAAVHGSATRPVSRSSRATRTKSSTCRADARVIATATNGYCPVAGLAVGERAWTLQGHPEFVPDLADHLLAGRVELIGAERVATARASLTQPLDRATVARWIANFFVD